MTKAAQRFLEAAVRRSGDNINPWQQTALYGLSEHDQDALLELCQPEDDVAQVIAEVMAGVRQHLSNGHCPH